GTFIDGGGAQTDGGRGDGVIDVGGGGCRADDQALGDAGADAGDGGGEAGGVAVHVLAVVGGDGEGTGGLPIGDGDVALVGMDRGDAVRGVRQGRREHVVGAGAFIHRRGAEADGGIRHRIADVGGRRGGADDEALEAATADAGDAGGEAGGVA